MKLAFVAAAVGSLAVAGCAEVGLVKPRTDTVANACTDIGQLFKEGLEYRLAGVAATKIVEAIGENSWVDQETAALITAQVMAQVLPRAKAEVDPYLKQAEQVMAGACVTASSLEPVVKEVEVVLVK